MVAISSAPLAQPFWRGLIRPMLLASLALHGLILFIPTPSAPKPRAETEEKVSLTQLPSALTTPAATPTATPAARPSPTPVRPTPQPTLRRVPSIQRANPVPPIPRSIAPRQTAVVRQQAAPQQAASATTQPAEQAAAPSAPPATDPFVQGFPAYQNAQQGSFDGLPPAFATSGFRTDDPLTTVAAFFEAQLPSANYTVNALVNEGSTQRVYEVSRNGETQYLTLFANPTGSGATYVLTKERLPDDLGDANLQDPAASELFTNLGSIIFETGLDWQDVDPTSDPVNTLLSSPESFFTSAETPDAGRRSGVLQAQIGATNSQATIDALTPLLERDGIAIAPVQDYGGGSVYQLSRENPGSSSPVTAYIVLVATNDGRTMLALWDRPPA